MKPADHEFIDRVIVDSIGRCGAHLGILEAVQDHHPNKYLPLETLEYIAGRIGRFPPFTSVTT